MAVRLNPFLGFEDNVREAMSFYQSVFGGELTTSTFADFHAGEDASEQDKIMHSQLDAPDGLVLMAADTPSGPDPEPRPRSGGELELARRGRPGVSLARLVPRADWQLWSPTPAFRPTHDACS